MCLPVRKSRTYSVHIARGMKTCVEDLEAAKAEVDGDREDDERYDKDDGNTTEYEGAITDKCVLLFRIVSRVVLPQV